MRDFIQRYALIGALLWLKNLLMEYSERLAVSIVKLCNENKLDSNITIKKQN